jgi:hypothetical protein
VSTRREVETCATHDEQLSEWLEGRNKHVVVGDTYECCPDFSCCRPHLAQPTEVRRAFASADQRVRNKLLGAFLGALIANARPDLMVHVVAGDPEVPS